MRSWRILVLAPALLLSAATVCRAQTPRVAMAPASAPSEVVERFMRLVASGDYVQMGNFFGTREGPITRRDNEHAVERRMYAIANILKNERFVLRAQEQIPGRGAEASQITVQLTQSGTVRDIPFVVVRSAQGGWLVEQIDLERITKTQ